MSIAPTKNAYLGILPVENMSHLDQSLVRSQELSEKLSGLTVMIRMLLITMQLLKKKKNKETPTILLTGG